MGAEDPSGFGIIHLAFVGTVDNGDVSGRHRDRLEANRRSWDQRVDVHRRTRFYDVDGFRAGASSLRPVEVEELGDVGGRSLLHLQCHFGLDTLSLARLGAVVTGVDFSEAAIELATSLAAELDMPARFIRSDVYELTRVLHEQFDIVFTSYGVLCWLPDIPVWARVVSRFLRPGGRFVIVENHPVAACFEEVDGRLELTYPLFQREPFEWMATDTYADRSIPMEPSPMFEWSWTVSGMVSSLIDAGLRIESLRELPVSSWQRFPAMVQDPEGWWRLPNDPLPLLVGCRAVKPL
jgi:SAM-dependent methyltransferase